MAPTKAQKKRKLSKAQSNKLYKKKLAEYAAKDAAAGRKPKATRRRVSPRTKKLNGMSKSKAPSAAPSGNKLMPMSVQSQAAFQYALALSDPFTAALNTGIPMGQLGLPTFKTTKYSRMVIDAAAGPTLVSSGGTVFAAGTFAMDVVVTLTAVGLLQFQYSTGGTTTFSAYSDMAGGTPGLINGRIVAASIRIQRMGRRDDAGLKYGIRRQCNDGTENQPGFTSNDFFQVNYHPKNNWDVDFKVNVVNHPTNFNTSIGLSFAGVMSTATAYEVECIAIVESNFDTPPANVYDHSQYTLTVSGVTRNASTDVFPERLHSVSKAAGLNRYISPSINHQDPHSRVTENTMTSVTRDQVNAVGLGTRFDQMFWDAMNSTSQFGYSVYSAIPSADNILANLDSIEQSIVYGAELATKAREVADRTVAVAALVNAVLPHN